MYQLAHVVNTILFRAKEEDLGITPMKLQKMLYFLYAIHYYNYKDALFSERFEAWDYGPVIADVYYTYRDRKARRITRYMPDANGKYKIVDLASNPRFSNSFNEMWQMCSGKSGIDLSKMTHEPYTAWYKARMNDQNFLSDSDIDEEMRKRNER